MNVRTSITPEQKKRRFLALTREENIRTGRELLEDLEGRRLADGARSH
jgi:hypothetical protein